MLVYEKINESGSNSSHSLEINIPTEVQKRLESQNITIDPETFRRIQQEKGIYESFLRDLTTLEENPGEK